MREVYIGNGQTITVSDSINGKVIDVKKLKEIIKNNKDKEIYCGMRSDWYFTAKKVSGEFDFLKDSLVYYSSWDTPVVRIGEDREEEIDVSIEDNGAYTAGAYDGYNRAQMDTYYIPREIKDRLRKLKYDLREPFVENLTKLLNELEEVGAQTNKQ